MTFSAEDWFLEIRADKKLLSVPVAEIVSYRDLILMLVRRNFVARYKQTILGPLWLVIQPILTTGVFAIVFGGIADLSTDGLPHTVFYLSGVTCWTMFASTLAAVANTFRDNIGLFGKVYFPRLIVPLATAVSNGATFLIQLALLLAVSSYVHTTQPVFDLQPGVVALPLLAACIAACSVGIGLIISSMTAKYRDLAYLVGFGIQLLMYASPVIYPVSAVPARYRPFVELNPMAHLIEAFRHIFFGTGRPSPGGILYAVVSSVTLLLIGVLMFNQVERKFVDTI